MLKRIQISSVVLSALSSRSQTELADCHETRDAPEMSSIPTVIKHHCNTCHGLRNHIVIASHRETGSHVFDDDFQVEWTTDYFIVKCQGCDGVSLRRDAWDDVSEDSTVTSLPSPVFRPTPSWLGDSDFQRACPKGTIPLLREVYKDLQNNCTRSAAMCVRAIVETIMVKEIGDQGSFKANLRKFTGEGYLSKKQLPTLEDVLDAGHATIHRNYQPDQEQLIIIVDVLEGLMQTLYVQPAKAKKLKAGIPPRPPRPPPSPLKAPSSA